MAIHSQSCYIKCIRRWKPLSTPPKKQFSLPWKRLMTYFPFSPLPCEMVSKIRDHSSLPHHGRERELTWKWSENDSTALNHIPRSKISKKSWANKNFCGNWRISKPKILSGEVARQIFCFCGISFDLHLLVVSAEQFLISLVCFSRSVRFRVSVRPVFKTDKATLDTRVGQLVWLVVQSYSI